MNPTGDQNIVFVVLWTNESAGSMKAEEIPEAAIVFADRVRFCLPLQVQKPSKSWSLTSLVQ